MLCIDSFGTQQFFKQLEKRDMKDQWKLTTLLRSSLGEDSPFQSNFEVELNRCGEKLIYYNAPWPANQILTRPIQDRYNLIFRFLRTMQCAIEELHARRLEKTLIANRLHLLSFLNSLRTFTMHSVIVPAAKAIDWTTAHSVDHLLDMQETLLKQIETKLFLHVLFVNVASVHLAFLMGIFRAL
jgi:hypothetical protein